MGVPVMRRSGILWDAVIRGDGISQRFVSALPVSNAKYQAKCLG